MTWKISLTFFLLLNKMIWEIQFCKTIFEYDFAYGREQKWKRNGSQNYLNKKKIELFNQLSITVGDQFSNMDIGFCKIEMMLEKFRPEINYHQRMIS